MSGMLYLIRGLPGSGKSTFAQAIIGAVNHEADNFFMVNGEYKFNRDLIAQAHKDCQLTVEQDMVNGVSSISVSNTFSQKWELEPYYRLALKYNYQVTEITMTGVLRNSIHGVPIETITRMRERWEK